MFKCVYMLLSAYVMHAIEMIFNKRPLTYLLTYLVLISSIHYGPQSSFSCWSDSLFIQPLSRFCL